MYHGEIMMTGSGPAVLSQGGLATPLPDMVDSRFGRVKIDPRQQLHFSAGMLGMPGRVHYCLTRFPSEKMARFKLLQSLDEPTLSFITLPVEHVNPIIGRDDLELAAKDMGIPMAELAVLLVVTVHRELTGVRLSVNARAPVLIHTAQRSGTQYVFSHTRYQIRQALTL